WGRLMLQFACVKYTKNAGDVTFSDFYNIKTDQIYLAFTGDIFCLKILLNHEQRLALGSENISYSRELDKYPGRMATYEKMMDKWKKDMKIWVDKRKSSILKELEELEGI